jgi:hypothetical protein
MLIDSFLGSFFTGRNLNQNYQRDIRQRIRRAAESQRVSFYDKEWSVLQEIGCTVPFD